MSCPNRPGKTGPRLLADLLTYDPRYEERAGRNLLTDPPPHHDPHSTPQRAVPTRNCRHEFMTKHEQCQLPKAGEEPNHETVYRIASFCQKCRWHLDLIVDFRDDGSRNSPCNPNSTEYSIHHFIFDAEDTSQHGPYQKHNAPRNYKFSCSAPKCPMELRLCLLPPYFTDDQLSVMTNKAALRKRLDDARQIDPDRADTQMARPVDALDFLSTYLNDSLTPKAGKRRVPVRNRKFLKTFGKDCDSILKAFGFTFAEEELEDGALEEVWYLPQPPPAGHPLDQRNLRTKIEDGRHELNSRISDIPASERQGARNGILQPQPSIKELERALGCLDYDKKPMSRTESRNATHEEDHPYYAGLGAVGDFSDALVLFAYSCQVVADPRNGAYYFECLQDLAIGRQSNLLGEQVQMLASQGQTNRKEVMKAYNHFGIDPSHAAALSDEIIIGQFRSRLSDIGPAQVYDTREQLRIIGQSRNSQKILEEASDAIETYSQALSWLELDETHSDEYVSSMYAIKKDANADTARRAVQIIAEHRQSQRLFDFLTTGTMASSNEMDVGEAYALLGLDDRTATVDLTALDLQVQANIDQTGEADKYNKAYALIRKDQQETHGNQGYRPEPEEKHDPNTWPVGCRNIGNTCYLNSVLQFLFTIRPLRERILEFDDYMQETTPEALEAKRKVGRSTVTLEKVQRAQKFVKQLQELFQCMITCAEPNFRPKEELAVLALSKDDLSKVAAAETSHQLTTANLNGLGEINGVAVVGPLPPPGHNDREGSTTAEADHDEDHAMADVDDAAQVEPPNGGQEAPPEPPNRPPPVPPRPQAQTTEQTTLKLIGEKAQQQDAAEILNNVFDLISCAMKGEDESLADNEQKDLIKQLFFSNITSIFDTEGKITSMNTPQDNHLISPGNRDRSLYSALDDEFSLIPLDVEGGKKATKYDSISRAAPIQIINVRRLVFEKGQSRKDNSHIALDNTFYFDRYLKQTGALSPDELLARRKEQWGLQEQLRVLSARKAELMGYELTSGENQKVAVSEAAAAAGDFIESLNKKSEDQLVDIDEDPIPHHPDLPAELRRGAEDTKKELEDLDEHMKHIDTQVNSLFSDCQDQPYQLHAIFMHRGGAGSGHYWIYIYDAQSNMWREYNDEHVRRVKDEAVAKLIFGKEEGARPATSTGIVYIRKDLVDRLTQAVCREPETKDPSLNADTEMPDADPVEYTSVEVLQGVGGDALCARTTHRKIIVRAKESNSNQDRGFTHEHTAAHMSGSLNNSGVPTLAPVTEWVTPDDFHSDEDVRALSQMEAVRANERAAKMKFLDGMLEPSRVQSNLLGCNLVDLEAANKAEKRSLKLGFYLSEAEDLHLLEAMKLSLQDQQPRRQQQQHGVHGRELLADALLVRKNFEAAIGVQERLNQEESDFHEAMKLSLQHQNQDRKFVPSVELLVETVFLARQDLDKAGRLALHDTLINSGDNTLRQETLVELVMAREDLDLLDQKELFDVLMEYLTAHQEKRRARALNEI